MAQAIEPSKSKARHTQNTYSEADKEFDEEHEKKIAEAFKEESRENTRKHRMTMGFILVED